MNKWTQFFSRQAHGLKNAQFDRTGTNSFYASQQQFLRNQRAHLNHVKGIQKSILGSELQKNQVIQTVKRVVQEIIPKTVQSMYLRLKVNMQMLIGNTFGFRFQSLEANINKLEKVE
jgi:hypothetical protein